MLMANTISIAALIVTTLISIAFVIKNLGLDFPLLFQLTRQPSAKQLPSEKVNVIVSNLCCLCLFSKKKY